MPSFTPRGPEIEAMITVLTDDSYADEKAMARALLKAAYDQFEQRDWFTIGVAPGVSGRPVAFYGLGGSENALKKDIEATLQVGGRALMVPINSVAALKERQVALEEEWGKSDLCGRCKHREASHGFVAGNGKRLGTPPGVPPCSAKCGCPGFITEKAWKEQVKREAEEAKRQREIEEELSATDGGADELYDDTTPYDDAIDAYASYADL